MVVFLAVAEVEVGLLVGVVCSSFKEFKGTRPGRCIFFSEIGFSLKNEKIIIIIIAV